MAFGRAEKIEGIFRGESDGEGAGFGEADVFAGYADHAAGEIERIFAALEHTREPVEGRVGIGIADGFVQGGDKVEVLLAGFVVTQESSLQHVFEELRGDGARLFFTQLRAADGKLERVVSGAGLPIRKRGDTEEDVVGRHDGFVSEAAYFVIQGAAEEFHYLRGS